jgi:hypothetical protein
MNEDHNTRSGDRCPLGGVFFTCLALAAIAML